MHRHRGTGFAAEANRPEGKVARGAKYGVKVHTRSGASCLSGRGRIGKPRNGAEPATVVGEPAALSGQGNRGGLATGGGRSGVGARRRLREGAGGDDPEPGDLPAGLSAPRARGGGGGDVPAQPGFFVAGEAG